MAWEELEAEANLVLGEIDAGAENRHALYLRLREALLQMRAYGMPLPGNLVRVERELEAEFGGPPETTEE
ncbi:MAG: hypothetical protein RIM84_14540 [Alphaproteobacteria bacterium]